MARNWTLGHPCPMPDCGAEQASVRAVEFTPAFPGGDIDRGPAPRVDQRHLDEGVDDITITPPPSVLTRAAAPSSFEEDYAAITG